MNIEELLRHSFNSFPLTLFFGTLGFSRSQLSQLLGMFCDSCMSWLLPSSSIWWMQSRDGCVDISCGR